MCGMCGCGSGCDDILVNAYPLLDIGLYLLLLLVLVLVLVLVVLY